MDAKPQEILDETGGDIPYAVLFIEAAKQRAAERGKYIPQYLIDLFYQEVENGRKRRERRING